MKVATKVNLRLLTNHAYVLILLNRNNTMRMREIAIEVRVTERAVQRIVEDLINAGFVSTVKSGRRNVYALNPEKHIDDFLLQNHPVQELLTLYAS